MMKKIQKVVEEKAKSGIMWVQTWHLFSRRTIFSSWGAPDQRAPTFSSDRRCDVINGVTVCDEETRHGDQARTEV